MRQWGLWLVVGLVWVLGACTLIAPSSNTELLATPTPSLVPCPLKDAELELPDTLSFDNVRGQLVTYLNTGGNLNTLASQLEARAFLLESAIENPTPYDPPLGNGVFVGDVNGDNTKDVVVNVHDPAFDAGGQQGLRSKILVYLCLENRYWEGDEIEFTSMGGQPESELGLRVTHVVDLDEDNSLEIVSYHRNCGAHTCYTNFQIYTWGNRLELLVPENAISYPSAGYEVIDNQLLVHSGTIGSVGAGPQRPYDITYAWDGSTLAVVDRQPTALPEYGFQAIYDGLDALASGDYDNALGLFNRVLTDTTLQDASTIFAEGNPRPTAVRNGLAHYGILLASVARDGVDAETTQQALESLTAIRQLPIYQDQLLSENLWRRYGLRFYDAAASGDLTTACAIVREDIELTARRIDIPELFVADYWPDYGYGNLPPEPEVVCPFD
jgi:hypothetical protein